MQQDGATCAMPTGTLSHCSRRPRYAYELRTRGRWETVGQYCAQHANGAGLARMLLPRFWEYDRVRDIASGVIVKDNTP